MEKSLPPSASPVPFIVFEGLDGSGKSTLIQLLAQQLKGASQLVTISREPGGTPLGEELRTFLSGEKKLAICPWAEMFLFAASRSQHVSEKIRPALAEKKWVLLDRYTASSLAFQGSGRGLNLAQIRQINEVATEGLIPSLTVLLDITAETAQSRRAHRQPDRIEQEAREFHERVRQSFLHEARSNPTNWLILDSNNSPDKLCTDLWKVVKQKWSL